MKRNRIALAGSALLVVGALALAGCAGGNDAGNDDSTASTTAIISANGGEPENALIPTNTNEVNGGKILDSIFAGLAFYDGDGALVNDMAESITVDAPNKVTVKLKEGNKFTNGEDVVAHNFIDAWNYGAQLSNAQLNQSWFADIVGFNPDADSELTGLTEVDDQTFTIDLSSDVASDFVTRLGYSAFYPLPDVAFEDMDAFGENPIGNGPYKLAEDGAWQHDVQIDMVKNDDYKGERVAQNGGLTLKFYTAPEGAYADLLGGNIDVIDQIPEASLEVFEDELGERATNQPAAIFQSFTIGGQLPHFSGEEGALRRAAISMAINRDEITDKIFAGTRTPASDFTTPVIDGWSDSIPGAEVLAYDPEKAKELWTQADAISPWSGTFQIAYNSDGGHQVWVDAVSNSLKNTLGIEASGAPYVDLATLRAAVNARDDAGKRTIQTANRSGWQGDYPAVYNFLQPLYGTGASSNDGDYSNPEVDALLAEGAAATSADDANAAYEKAQEILFKDLPVIPLWYQNSIGGFGENVDNVTVGWNSVPLYYEITKAE
ncbi:MULTISPECIES: peptide ABC transporter substrate-binding protein [Microbacterium]|uniref:ABC transporter substrate-binding protein n=1 Tax=Microbacterium algeriense TaxID=2615184 RepID=A0ABQ6V508_9MICO|nr:MULTISPECIES: ABC transporter substrate-binding protein [Microbacterium]AZH78033.1 ABC transporter substrate-binding protein [Microbacterium sp. Y-01]KAB1864161.1 ABC transporter substrate-binding protein [Microbacterium algeriense]MDX2398565.1 ABC transporter substrate-binding protein [Microbacterium algeriense]